MEEKIAQPNTAILKDLLSSLGEGKIRREQNQQFDDDISKIDELTSQLAATKETLRIEVQLLEDKTNELNKQNTILEELKAGKNKLLQEIKLLEEKRNSLKFTKPNLQDQQLLEQGRKKLKFYKELTGIQWDYENIEHSIKGYVSNKHDYIHHFSYELDTSPDSLWHEISLSISKNKVGKENVQQNV